MILKLAYSAIRRRSPQWIDGGLVFWQASDEGEPVGWSPGRRHSLSATDDDNK